MLILGANGRFGLAAAQAFADAGWHVLAQVRRAPAAAMPAGAEILQVPLEAVAGVLASRAAAAPGVVVHAINPIYTRWDAEVMPAARLGLDVAERFGALFMLPGNVYPYGEAMPALLDESTPAQPTTAKGRLRARLDAEIAARAAAGRVRAAIVVAGDFFGGGSGSWLDQAIVKPIGKGRLDYPGPLDRMHAWAYLPDLAAAFVAIASAAAPQAFTRYTFAGHAVSGHEFLAALERAADGLGLRPPGGWRHGRLPWRLIGAIGVLVPLWRELARMSYLWRVPHRLDGRGLARAVGQLPATPLDAALTASLRELGIGKMGQVAPSPAHATSREFA